MEITPVIVNVTKWSYAFILINFKHLKNISTDFFCHYRLRNGKGAGMMSSSSNGKWSTQKIDKSLSFVCEKPVGGT